MKSNAENPNRVAIAAFILLLLVLVAAAKPLNILKPSKDAVVRDWLVVPVFYATNRLFTGTPGSNGSIEYSDEPNNAGPLFGVKNVVVPNPTSLRMSAQNLKRMGWQEILGAENQAGQIPSIDQEKCPLKDRVLSRDEIVSSFQEYSTATAVHDRVVFVHGCCANFDTSMKRAAKIAAHFRTPVLLYDWVSPVGFRNYLVNETRVGQTVDDFCRFMANVDKVADPSTITVLGHSMGAEFVDEAMVRRAIKCKYQTVKPYHEIIMSNADVDARSFLKHAQEFVSNGSIVHIFISSKDDPLHASAFEHGRFPRLGEPGPLLDELVKVKGTNVVDISELGTGHEIPFEVVAAFHSGDPSVLSPALTVDKREPGYIYLKKTAP